MTNILSNETTNPELDQMAFTVQDILNARPNLSMDGTLTGDVELVREDTGYSVKMTGYYSLPELLAIAREVQNLNVVFAERPEESAYTVENEARDIFAGPFNSYANAKARADQLESEEGEHFYVRPVINKR